MYFLREPPDQPVIYPVNYDTLCAIAARFLEHKPTPIGDGWTVMLMTAGLFRTPVGTPTRCILLGGVGRVWQHPDTMDIMGSGSESNSAEYIGAMLNILSYHYLGERPFSHETRTSLRRNGERVHTSTMILVPALTAMAVDAVDRDVINATVVRG